MTLTLARQHFGQQLGDLCSRPQLPLLKCPCELYKGSPTLVNIRVRTQTTLHLPTHTNKKKKVQQLGKNRDKISWSLTSKFRPDDLRHWQSIHFPMIWCSWHRHWSQFISRYLYKVLPQRNGKIIQNSYTNYGITAPHVSCVVSKAIWYECLHNLIKY
jgi:hypothetical protein